MITPTASCSGNTRAIATRTRRRRDSKSRRSWRGAWVDRTLAGVPFLLRTGKRLAVSEQRVTLVLKTPSGGPVADPPPTTIGLSLQGSGELEIEVVTKQPGLDIALTTGTAVLPLSRGGGPDLPAYATLIRDVLKGDRSLFTSSEGLAAAWRTLADLLEHRPEVLPYAQGSWGPEAAQELPGPATAGTCSTTAPSENDGHRRFESGQGRARRNRHRGVVAAVVGDHTFGADRGVGLCPENTF